VRQFTKWDYQPGSIHGVPDSFARAYSIMMSEPKDRSTWFTTRRMQEAKLTENVTVPVHRGADSKVCRTRGAEGPERRGCGVGGCQSRSRAPREWVLGVGPCAKNPFAACEPNRRSRAWGAVIGVLIHREAVRWSGWPENHACRASVVCAGRAARQHSGAVRSAMLGPRTNDR
jgi:hypothetical protein